MQKLAVGETYHSSFDLLNSFINYLPLFSLPLGHDMLSKLDSLEILSLRSFVMALSVDEDVIPMYSIVESIFIILPIG